MRPLSGIASVAALAVVLTAVLSACGGQPSGAHAGQGVVESVDVEARKVTLDHEDIPGAMKAMTMMFDVAPGVALEDLRPGAEVDFSVKEEGGVYTVTEIRRSGS